MFPATNAEDCCPDKEKNPTSTVPLPPPQTPLASMYDGDNNGNHDEAKDDSDANNSASIPSFGPMSEEDLKPWAEYLNRASRKAGT